MVETDSLWKFLDWWQSLIQTGETFPSVRRFDPVSISDLAPSLFMVDRLLDGSFRFSYLGERLRQLTLKPLDTERYLDVYSAASAEFLADNFSIVTGRGCGAYVRQAVTRIDGSVVDGGYLGLPFASGDGVIRNMAALSFIHKVTAPGKKQREAHAVVLEEAFLDLGNGIPDGKKALCRKLLRTSRNSE